MEEGDGINSFEKQAMLISAKERGEESIEACRKKKLARNLLPPATIPMAEPLQEQAQP